MKVKDVMHKGAASVAPEATIRECAQQMKTLDIGVLPVRSNGSILGIITDRDIAVRGVAEGVDLAKIATKSLMTKQTFTCSADDDLDDAIKVMKMKKVRRLPVANSKGELVGMLSLGDLCAAASDETLHSVVKAVAAHHA